jgi:Tfp pilus assembly protein PilO
MTLSLLDVDLALRRPAAPYWLAALFVLIAIAIHQLATAPMVARVDERAREFAQLRRPAMDAALGAAPAKTLLEERYAAFVQTLGEKRELGAMVGAVFELAEKHGLVLAQAEYKLELDRAGGFHVYQMRLPVRGAYPRVRGFVDATLARIACAALEDVDFKRDAIGTADVEARLRFLFFLKDSAQ